MQKPDKILYSLYQHNPQTLRQMKKSIKSSLTFHRIAKLLTDGLVEIRGERFAPNDRPEKLYVITKKGKDALFQNLPYCTHQYKNGRRSFYCHLRHRRINPDICRSCTLRGGENG